MKRTYTDSIYYRIRLTARYLKLYGEQLFEKLGLEIPFDEFIALDVIRNNEGICQRDLAKLLVKDRANTGRLATSLEKKLYIEIKMDKKNNRLVNKLFMTNKGKEFMESVIEKLEPALKLCEGAFGCEYEEKLNNMLRNFLEIVQNMVDTQKI